VVQPGRLVIGFDVAGFEVQKFLVHAEGLLGRERLLGMFLVKPSEVQTFR